MSELLLYLCAGLNHLLWSHIVDTCSLFYLRGLQILKVFLPISLVHEHTHKSLAHIHSLTPLPKNTKGWQILGLITEYSHLQKLWWNVILIIPSLGNYPFSFFYREIKQKLLKIMVISEVGGECIFFSISNHKPLESEFINLKLVTNF